MSAIPWVGQDIVEFIWGGLSKLLIEEPNNSDVVQQILLNAGISPILVLGYVCIIFFNIGVKKPKSRGQSAGVRELFNLEASQRLNAKNLNYAYLVGLFEGVGFFTVTKKGKYFQCELGIELSIKDVQLIYKIKNLLGVGIVSFREIKEISMVSLRVRKKEHLINKILPIFDKYPLFSNKQHDYLRLRKVILSYTVFYDVISDYIRPSLPFNSIESIENVPYFSAWLVGFIEAKGCFSVYKLDKADDYFVASFDISQTNGEILILAIRKYLYLTPQPYKDKTNNFKLKVTSVRSIENVTKFLNKTPVKLLGNKKLQYLLWIKKLRTIRRYAEKINILNKY
jgi:LAGLIDADG endonuclease